MKHNLLSYRNVYWQLRVVSDTSSLYLIWITVANSTHMYTYVNTTRQELDYWGRLEEHFIKYWPGPCIPARSIPRIPTVWQSRISQGLIKAELTGLRTSCLHPISGKHTSCVIPAFIPSAYLWSNTHPVKLDQRSLFTEAKTNGLLSQVDRPQDSKKRICPWARGGAQANLSPLLPASL